MMDNRRLHLKTARQLGFTLIELMIAVAIVAILARVAYGVYKQYVIRANRADAQQVLLLAAQNAERWFVVNNGSYAGYDPSSTAIGLGRSPTSAASDSVANYTIKRVATVSTTPVTDTTSTLTFILQATPNSSRINKSDGLLTITNTGVKGWDRNNDGDTADANENTWTP